MPATIARPRTAPPALIQSVGAALPKLAGLAWSPLPGGRVNTVWRVGDHVVKLFDPNGESPLFPNNPAAEAAALRLAAPLGLAPSLCATGPGWLSYSHVMGQPWVDDPRPVAQALTRLHSIPAAPPEFRTLASGSTAILAQAMAIADECQGALPPMPPDPDIGPVAPSVLHGDAVPGNIIVHQGRITLIDWQCPALGDPVEDIATFLSPAMQWLYSGQPLTETQTDMFLAALPADRTARYRALAPAFHWRMAANCLWKAERGAPDYRHALHLELELAQP